MPSERGCLYRQVIKTHRNDCIVKVERRAVRCVATAGEAARLPLSETGYIVRQVTESHDGPGASFATDRSSARKGYAEPSQQDRRSKKGYPLRLTICPSGKNASPPQLVDEWIDKTAFQDFGPNCHNCLMKGRLRKPSAILFKLPSLLAKGTP